MRDTIVAITMTEARSAIENIPQDDLEARFRAAFDAAMRGFMAPTMEEAWAAGCEAVYLLATDEQRDRIQEELHALNSIAALAQGLPIDISRIEAPENPIGIRAIFMESPR